MIKNTTTYVHITPTDADREPLGPSTVAIQHILYHLASGERRTEISVSMIDSDQVLEIERPGTLHYVHVSCDETELDAYIPVTVHEMYRSPGTFTTGDPLYFYPGSGEGEQS